MFALAEQQESGILECVGGEDDRADRSIRDHMNIIQALEARDTERAEDLVRQHALGLAEHVARHADYLD